jgi:transcriptional/translational regulatory protein YebC/TACO1
MKIQSVGEFIQSFIDILNLNYTADQIIQAALQRSVELIYSDSDTTNDIFVKYLEDCQDWEEIKQFMEENYEYYEFFMSAVVIIFEEVTRDMQFTPEQSRQVNELLDQLEGFEEV